MNKTWFAENRNQRDEAIMAKSTTVTNIAIFTVALAIAVGFCAFFAVSAPGGARAPSLAGLMLFVLAVPMAVPQCRSFASKLAAVAIVALAALLVSAATVRFNAGHGLQGVMILVVLLAEIVVVAVVSGRLNRLREERTRVLEGVVSSIIVDAADEMKVSFHPSANDLKDPNSGTRQVIFAERLALGVVWQASTEDDPELFKEAVMRGLSVTHQSLLENTAMDPRGQAGLAVKVFMRRVGGYLQGERWLSLAEVAHS